MSERSDAHSWSERFWLWLRRNLYTEAISRTTHAIGSRQQFVLAELEEIQKELTIIRAAVGDMRVNLDLPPMVPMDDINERRSPSGDPTGL